MRLRSVLLFGVALPILLSARSPKRVQTEPLVEWIVGLQEMRTLSESAGAISMHADPSFYLDGHGYRHVVPYFSNLAVAALLDTTPTAESLDVAEAWIDWFLGRTGPHGVPVEHWVSMDSGQELTCPAMLSTQPAVERCEAIDATDSAAATFLMVLDAYHAAGGEEAFLRQREAGIRGVAETLLDLQDTDGLTIARTDYPVKYLMDNAETVAGLRAMARLEKHVFGLSQETYGAAADHAADGLATFTHADTQLLAWAKMPDGTLESAQLTRWYADAVAQVWPLVFGVTEAASGYHQLDTTWNGTEHPDWTRHRDASGFAWPVLSVAALRAGDVDAARRQVDVLWQRHITSGEPGPFTVADAGWLLRSVDALGD